MYVHAYLHTYIRIYIHISYQCIGIYVGLTVYTLIKLLIVNILDVHKGERKCTSKSGLLLYYPSCFFGTELHVSPMKEATDDDVTDQAQTYDPLNATNNESKHI